MKRVLRSFLLIAIVAAAARAQSDTARFASVRDTIRAILQAGNLPSLAVAVARGDQILWEEGFGYANREKKIPATANTMYSMASISKPFTATGLMVLLERGRVDLDHPANEYLGASKLRVYEGDAAAVTLRRILSHSAGLPLHYQFFYDGIVKPISDDDAIAKYGFAGYPPGSAYFYSNLGFGIIGHISGRVSGKGYEAFMRDEVFAPLGLRNTTVSSGAGLGSRAAVRYDNDLKPIVPYVFDHAGASAVWSSAHDLIRFAMFHLGATLPDQKQIISRDTRERMQRPEAPPTSPGSSYGLGWATLENDHGYRRISHTGGMPGVTTALNLYPSEQVAIVVLANRAGAAAVPRVLNAIAGIVLANYRTALPPAGGGTPRPALSTLAGQWRGTVRVDRDSIPLILDVRADGDIHVRTGALPETVLSGASLSNGMLNGRFLAPLRAPDATPKGQESNVTVALTLLVRGDKMTGWLSSVTRGEPAYGAVSYYAAVAKSAAPPR